MIEIDLRPDGFVYVWDYPDDPDEPCWDEAAKLAVPYIAALMGLDSDLDFKIECQSVDLREELGTNYIGSTEILISYEKYLKSYNKEVTLRDLGFIIDGFITGWMAAHTKPIQRDVHTEHCNIQTCKYGEEDCTVTTGKAPGTYQDDWYDNPMQAFGQGRGD